MKALTIPNINFIAKQEITTILSIILILISIISISYQGLKLGIDFTGGTIIEMQTDKNITLNVVRNKLKNNGFISFNVQYFGSTNEILIRLQPQNTSNAKLSSKVIKILGNDWQMRRVEFVGPQIGEELTNDGALAMLYALIGILIYIAIRFEYRFAIGSIIALIHDVIITIGIFSITQAEFDLTVLAAILAIIGYSLNDTIVVFDRIRENFLLTRKNDSKVIINDALNQTLSRTIMTSATTMLVLIALFFFGGEIIHNFAFALIIGVIIGTYSSIYVAPTTILLMKISKKDLLPNEKDIQAIDNRP